MGAVSSLTNVKFWKKHENSEMWQCGVEDKYWHFSGTSVLIYSTPQENHTLRYCSYKKVLSHYYLFAVTGSLIWHTKENHVPNVDLKSPANLCMKSVQTWLRQWWPLARTSSSWVWGRRNILITMSTMNLQDSQSTHTQQLWNEVMNFMQSNYTWDIRNSERLPTVGTHLLHTDTAYALNWPGLHSLGLCSHLNTCAKHKYNLLVWGWHGLEAYQTARQLTAKI